MAEVKLERETLGWDPAQIKDEPDVKQEPEEFPFHAVTVKAEDDDDESPVLRLRPTEGEECGSSDTDCSEDYSHQQAPAKRSYAMIPPDCSVPDSRPFACSDCGKAFKDKCVLQRHELYVHGGERPHQCSACGKSFKTKAVLNNHVKIHTGERSHVCSVCGKGFIKKFDLSRHQMSVHRLCPVCPERCSHEHLKTHVDEGALDESSFLFRETVVPFGCPECGASFRFDAQLRAHLSRHKKQRPHKCSVCGKTFTQKSTLKDHVKIHTGDKSFSCSVCQKRFAKKSDRTRHQTFVHHVCPVCSERVTDQASFHRHLKTHVDEGVLDPSSPLIRDTSKAFSCRECGKRYAWSSSLKAHMLCHTAGRPEAEEEEDPEVVPDQESPSTTVPPPEPFSCSECGKSFRWKSLLKIHMWVHVDEIPDVVSKEKHYIPFSCFECGKTMRKDVTTHMRKHGGGRAFLCSVCNKKRKRVHHVTCPVCSTRLRSKTKLKAHLRAHVKDGTLELGSDLLGDAIEPFGCADCGKKFMYGSSLQSHMKVHAGEGPLSCSECGKRFKKEKALQTHLRLHTGPLRCAVCDESFTSNRSLRRHTRTHEERKRFACSVCDEAFGAKAALTIHMKTHREERPFVCDVCDTGFVQRRDLIQHQRQVHHVCPVCSQRFTGRSELKAHLSGHSEAQLREVLNPFACSQCGKRFSLRRRLQTHMTSHSEERPFQCGVCEKRFVNKSYLTHHMKTHRGDCPECGKKIKSGLSSHLRTVHRVSVCSVCKERFTDKASLKEHMMKHVEDGTFHRFSAQPYYCAECGELFFRKNSLQRHEREAHRPP